VANALAAALARAPPAAQQRAAAAVANAAFGGAEERDRLAARAGLLDALLQLLRVGDAPGRESALAALSNLCANKAPSLPPAAPALVCLPGRTRHGLRRKRWHRASSAHLSL
jgi:hypothetical protein